ncbi:hypothetical protein DC3_04510 [Deinococcus cellulosilyticus NBRC 106333 = KACC 11606]|uniref:Uncharacterized protein n=1 Tax=Deinococcus cellulosilyticus (strain DSM 18568 / NBRC 106333 / KACC 11606 / 5516J-15) TaxID=1223518 RepID=A0A511MXF7_DEIC1|nr:hypothetical protein DC3_04510 [Deinococcus cellulosilyticus NBRC 106333 = KACC 11606]
MNNTMCLSLQEIVHTKPIPVQTSLLDALAHMRVTPAFEQLPEMPHDLAEEVLQALVTVYKLGLQDGPQSLGSLAQVEMSTPATNL